MQITPASAPAPLDLTVMQTVLPDRVLLLPSVQLVRTGTPLTYDTGGWRVIKPGESPKLFALSAAYGGDTVDVARALIIETHTRTLVPGQVAMVDPNSRSVLQFVNDPAGPYLALSPSRVMLGV